MKPWIELSQNAQILRLPLQRDRYQVGRDRTWSDIDIPDQGWDAISRRHAIVQKEGNHYRIYDGDGQTPSTNGIFHNHTRISATQGHLLTDGAQLAIGQDPSNQILLTYFNPGQRQPAASPNQRHLDLKTLQTFPVKLGRAANPQYYASMQLESPIISRLHATINRDGQGCYILQDHSTNGTFVNGSRIGQPVKLQDGDTIRIGPFTLLFCDGVLEIADLGNQIRLDAHKLVRQVSSKAGKKTILNDVSLAIEPGQFVALVGGSGAGKSTLMRTLLGIEPIASGNVFLNGDDLRRHFDIYRSQIGYVPQDDIVHRDLTVEEVLSYACKLRLPPDTEVNVVVQRALEQVKLSHVKTSFVRDLSGGQRKRVSIAVELLADPKLFFLDEPTSGLDPGLDKEMMSLLRELANQGRTVVLVTHATANIEECDRVAFMGRGGKLCYFGPPREALSFFEMPSHDFKYFADIYLKLEQGTSNAETLAIIDRWASKFLNSPDYQTYVKAHLSPGKSDQSVASPSRWTGISPLQQLLLLSERYLRLVLRDRTSFAITLLTGPIGIGLTALAVHDDTLLTTLNSPKAASTALKVLFIFSCIPIWVGLSSSVQEIIKEKAIYTRERLINLGLLTYLGSKVLIRAALGVMQTLLIILSISVCFKSPNSSLVGWLMGFSIINFLMLLASVSLGLMISAAVKNENEANSILPLVMIPQIIFSGVLFDLKGFTSLVSWLMVNRWSMRAYGTLVNVNAMIPKPPKVPPSCPPIPSLMERIPAYDATWQNFNLDWQMLCVHIGVCLTIALWLQKRKDVI